MVIVKQDGSEQEFNPQKILRRLKVSSEDLKVNSDIVFKKVIPLISSNMTTTEIDECIARECHTLSINHPDYGVLGARILMSRLYKLLDKKEYLERVKGKLNRRSIANLKEWGIPYRGLKRLDIENRTYLSAAAFIKEYAIKDEESVPLESPLEMYSRIFAYLADDRATYRRWVTNAMHGKFSLASPQLLNGGTKSSNMISCTSMSLKGDSRVGILSTVDSASAHSKNSAGLGIYVGELRSCETFYDQGRGKASGLVKGVKILEPFFDFFRQHENRKGAAAVTCDIWHRDIEDFIKMKDPNTIHSKGAHNLFYSVAIPNLFYKRTIGKENWTLVCPKVARDFLGFPLSSLHGKEWEEAYQRIEEADIPKKEVPAMSLMLSLVTSQAASGVPYVYNRDNGNKNHNHNNAGTIKSQQLCNEFLAYHDEEHEAQCDLAAIPLPNHVNDGQVDFESIAEATADLVVILNSVIDCNDWNTDVAKVTGHKQRAIGIGMVGLAELAMELNLPFDSPEFHKVQRDVQECIYYNAIKKSCELAKEKRFKQTEFIASTPLVTEGRFRFGTTPPEDALQDWESLRADVMEYGVVNSLFCCNMPTSSTSKLLGMTESFDALQAPVIKRRIVSGEFIVASKYVYNALEQHDLLTEEIVNTMAANKSVVGLGLPKDVENLYRNIYEIGWENIINMAIARQPYVDMGESMNMYFEEATANNLVRALVLGAKGGLTSGVYYTKIKKRTESNKDLGFQKVTSKPDNSPFDCFGCSV